jgi:hypothetical protein
MWEEGKRKDLKYRARCVIHLRWINQKHIEKKSEQEGEIKKGRTVIR